MPALIKKSVSVVAADAAMVKEVELYSARPHWWRRLGRNMRLSRHDFGDSQRELALATGLHQTYISSLERGLRPYKPIDVVRIADALECTIDELLNHQLYPSRNADDAH